MRSRWPALSGSIIAALALGLGVAAAHPQPAAAACLPTPPCLEATFPPDYAWGTLTVGGAGNEAAEQVLAVTSNESWGVKISSDLADGRMTEWNGLAYVPASAKVLAKPLQWTLARIGAVAQPASYQAISGTAATVVSAQSSTCTETCASKEVAVRYRQAAGFADAPAGANDYRLLVTYEAAQGF